MAHNMCCRPPDEGSLDKIPPFKTQIVRYLEEPIEDRNAVLARLISVDYRIEDIRVIEILPEQSAFRFWIEERTD